MPKTKNEIFNEMLNLLTPYDLKDPTIDISHLFNYFSSNDLEGFVEFLKDEL